MWKLRGSGKASEDSGRVPPAPAEVKPEEEEPSGKLRRRAGCLWSFFTEPFGILAATIVVAIFGRAYLIRRAKKLRERRRTHEESPRHE
ncbi:hypothetical protein LLH03_14115 [bacterium]|nr:hypothetical protein [bacterium]